MTTEGHLTDWRERASGYGWHQQEIDTLSKLLRNDIDAVVSVTGARITIVSHVMFEIAGRHLPFSRTREFVHHESVQSIIGSTDTDSRKWCPAHAYHCIPDDLGCGFRFCRCPFEWHEQECRHKATHIPGGFEKETVDPLAPVIEMKKRPEKKSKVLPGQAAISFKGGQSHA